MGYCVEETKYVTESHGKQMEEAAVDIILQNYSLSQNITERNKKHGCLIFHVQFYRCLYLFFF